MKKSFTRGCSIALAIAVLAYGAVVNPVVYADEFTDKLRVIGGLLDEAPSGLSDIFDLGDGYTINLACDILDNKDPEEIASNFINGFLKSTVDNIISISGILVNLSDPPGTQYVVAAKTSSGKTVDSKIVTMDPNNYNTITIIAEFVNDPNEQISSFEMIRIVQHKSIVVLHSSANMSNGHLEITSKVWNHSPNKHYIGVAAIGYDEDDNVVEVGSNCAISAMLPGYIGDFKVTLEAGSIIKRVEVVPVGDAEEYKLIAGGFRHENGKAVATGVIENGTSEKHYIGVAAIGYDQNDNVVEVGSNCAISAMVSGYSFAFKVVLEAGSIIKRVEVIPVGNAEEYKLIAGGFRHESGKVIATGVIENGTSEKHYIGIAAIGYDQNNNVVEVGSNCAISAMVSGYSTNFKVTLEAGSIIKRVEVVPVGNAEEYKLIAGGFRHENGKAIATGVIENGTSEKHYIGIAAIGYDEDDNVVEVGSNCAMSAMVSGYSSAFKVALDAGSIIKRVKVIPVGNAEEYKLIAGGFRHENGKTIATGVIENGTSEKHYTGVAAIGYDEDDNVVEVGSNCAISAMVSGYSAAYKVTLSAGSIIKRVKVIPVGNAEEYKLITGGFRHENGKAIATGVIENGTSEKHYTGIAAIGYDEDDNVVEVGSDSAMSEMASGYSAAYKVTLSAGSIIKRVEVIPVLPPVEKEIITIKKGYRVEGSNIISTAVVQNGTDASKTITLTINGYDGADNLVATKTSSTTLSTRRVATLSSQISSKNIERIELIVN